MPKENEAEAIKVRKADNAPSGSGDSVGSIDKPLVEPIHDPEDSKTEEPTEKIDFRVGDTVRVHYTITEASKTRIQPYEGLVIAMKGSGVGRTFTVRHIAKGGVGVERIFPIHSPLIQKIDVLRRGKVRRSKLYYLRDRVGRAALKVKEGTKIQ